MNKCPTCGATCEGERCFRHKKRAPLPKIAKKNKQLETIRESSGYIDMVNMFNSIWKTRAHKSEISGERLGNEPLSIFFHHILPKSKYPEAQLDEENIILLTLSEHENVESDMYKYEKINYLRTLLKEKYGLE